MNPAALSAICVLALVLAGCSDAPAPADEILLESGGDGADTLTGGEAPTEQPPQAGQRGYVAGHVVNDALYPVEGATVDLPGMDDTATTLEDGAFSFADLWPGPYRVTATAPGHRSAEAIVEVVADEIVKLRFVLQRVAPPSPYHETQSFTGFAEVAPPDAPPSATWFCQSCTFIVEVEPEGLKGLVIEAFRETPPGSEAYGAEYYVYVASMESGRGLATCYCPNPARVELTEDDLTSDFEFYVDVRPRSGLMPEFSVSFEVYVTAFYHDPPPEGWTFVQGEVP